MKILYNVTVNVDENIVNDWTAWMINEHIPDVMKTGCFESYSMQRILTGEHQNGVNYSIMYTAPSQESLDRYISQHAGVLRKKHNDRYSNKCAAFRTIMKIISQG